MNDLERELRQELHTVADTVGSDTERIPDLLEAANRHRRRRSNFRVLGAAGITMAVFGWVLAVWGLQGNSRATPAVSASSTSASPAFSTPTATFSRPSDSFPQIPTLSAAQALSQVNKWFTSLPPAKAKDSLTGSAGGPQFSSQQIAPGLAEEAGVHDGKLYLDDSSWKLPDGGFETIPVARTSRGLLVLVDRGEPAQDTDRIPLRTSIDPSRGLDGAEELGYLAPNGKFEPVATGPITLAAPLPGAKAEQFAYVRLRAPWRTGTPYPGADLIVVRVSDGKEMGRRSLNRHVPWVQWTVRGLVETGEWTIWKPGGEVHRLSDPRQYFGPVENNDLGAPENVTWSDSDRIVVRSGSCTAVMILDGNAKPVWKSCDRRDQYLPLIDRLSPDGRYLLIARAGQVVDLDTKRTRTFLDFLVPYAHTDQARVYASYAWLSPERFMTYVGVLPESSGAVAMRGAVCDVREGSCSKIENPR